MKQDKEKIALFDFCETLVPFQSADAYVEYVLKHYDSVSTLARRVFFVLLRKFRLLNRFIRLTNTTHKEFVLWQLKGIPKTVMQNLAKQYYDERIASCLIPQTYERLKQLQKEGYRVVIVSGGYDIYLHFFAADNNIRVDDILATKLIFKENRFTGKMGDDCMNENKISRLEKKINKDQVYTVAYSDSLVDLPLLTWANEAYLVQHIYPNMLYGENKQLNLLYV